MASATLEEYLEAIYKLAEHGEVRPTQLAETLGVSGPTVTATLKRLKAHGLIERPDNRVVLTEEGRAGAIDIIRRHRLAERFLVDTLGLPWEDVHEEACVLEHALSTRVQAALERFLDNPTSCPHGHPIPAMDGTVAAAEGDPLSAHVAGDKLRIVRVEDEDEGLLSYLASLGMYPGTAVEVCDVAPFQGPLMLQVGDARYALGRAVCEKIAVVPQPGRHRRRAR